MVHLLQMWKKDVSSLSSKTFTKPVVLLLIWQFVGTILYHMVLSPALFAFKVGTVGTIYVSLVLSVVNFLSPIAGYLGDLKCTRFRLIKCGIFFIIAATAIGVTAILPVFIAIYNGLSLSTLFWYSISSSLLAMVMYTLGYMAFTANFIQFSADQLRDAPTRCCVLFLHMLLWTNSLSKTVAISAFIQHTNQTVAILSLRPLLRTTQFHIYTLLASLLLILLSSIIILLVAQWKHKWFVTDKIRGNPYKLLFKVLLFALKHKSPIRRSAFTFCEDELPSRIDFSKRRYGGPYSTDQVEDVKVLLNILKILFSLGPVFFLENASDIVSTSRHIQIQYFKLHLKSSILSPDLLSSVIIVLTLPTHVFLIKPLWERYAPTLVLNFFKRIGFSIFTLIIFFLVYLLYDGIAYDYGSNYNSVFEYCTTTNSSAVLNWNIVHIPRGYLLIIRTFLSALSHMLLYISVWEFILSQSPQNMKGLLFGLLFSIRACFRLLSIILLVPFVINWRATIISCRTGYNILCISVGIATLMLYGVCAKKYKYCKRDDICNVYKFAEDYYSK